MIVYLNGEFLPVEQAHISPLDRGFLFGDGVYEVIPAYSGRLFRIQQHLQRLDDSLAAIRMTNPYSNVQWVEILQGLMQHQQHENHSIYLQITRGADSKRDHAIPESISPTIFLMSTPLPVTPPDIHHQGACIITREDSRWAHCNVKAITLLANILLRQQAIDTGCSETLLIRDGYVIEGAASNIFIIKDGVIQTPPKGPLLLPGITRDLILEIATNNKIPTEEVDIPVEALHTADEIWMSSSTKEVLPVTQLDSRPVGDGKPGQAWKKMVRLYAEYKQQLIRGEVN